MTQTVAQGSKWVNVLWSAMGSKQAEPVVTGFVRDWGAVLLFCTEGLTKHVSDERIEQRLSSMQSASEVSVREIAEQLLQDALDGGGTDNITLIVGRTIPAVVV
jgi:protein phosphatase